ncbi:Uronate isomerase [subsurface metagenome]
MAKDFLDDDFLLQTEASRELYHNYACGMPIFDYHCHLPVREIAENRRFENLTRIWLAGDHYKWQAMRAFGIEERFITGDADDYEKFKAWAEVVPYTIRNPLYHWTHMELKNPFGITGKLLCPQTAEEIYGRCGELLKTDEFRARALMQRNRVKVVCTTDDPVDSLEHHFSIKKDEDFAIKVLPAFRPDKAMAVENPAAFNDWVDRLEQASGFEIRDYSSFVSSLKDRHDFFHEAGCRLSDHGIEEPYAADYTEKEVAESFKALRDGRALNPDQTVKFKSAVLFELALMDAESGWTQQFHFGALRNNNTRMFSRVGPDSGFDSMGDFQPAQALVRLLDRLDSRNKLARTILYVLNPRDNEMIASITGSFQDGLVPGKIQFGSAWWFNDQKYGIEWHLNALSSIGLLSRFVGMLTDSRSFLSYPRHDYFRRILCNLVGTDVENGELPSDLPWLGRIVQDICYNNAVKYFGIFEKHGMLPVRFLVKRREVHDLIKPLADYLKIEVEYRETLESVEEVKQSMSEYFGP